MKRWISFLVAAALAGLATPGFAAGLLIVTDEASWRWPEPPSLPPPHPPHPIPPPWPVPPPHPIPPPRPYIFAPFEISSEQVRVRINDQVAHTTIEQEIHNPNPARLEGTFLFPVPRGAALTKFAMQIDGRPVEAELLAADKARGIYEDIVRRAKDPALLEFAGGQVFKVRIFPFEPHSHKRVTLSYSQVLKADSGLVGYVCPLAAGKFSAQPIKSLGVKVELESPRPLKSIYSPSHTIEVKYDGERRATVGFEARDARPDADFQLFFAPEKSDVGLSLLTFKPDGGPGHFLLLASPGFGGGKQKVVLKDVAFVLDTSGSMAGKKLDQAKKALAFCVENLNDGDRFEIVRFSTDIELLFNNLVPASGDNRRRAWDFIKDLKPIGGTAIDDALRRALALRPEKTDRPFFVIFLTDGLPTVGATSEEQILANVRRASGGTTRVFCFGIGTDVNTHLLDQITEETRAFSQYVLPDEDLEVKVSGFFTKIKEPVLAAPQITFPDGVRVTKMYPMPLPDLFKGEQLVIVGQYAFVGQASLPAGSPGFQPDERAAGSAANRQAGKPAAQRVTLTGTVNGERREFTFEANFPDTSSEHDFIPRLWATRRVGYLLDEIRLHGENPELRDEVTELARQYGIVTPYTAYLIVEDEARRNVPIPMRSMRRLEEDRDARQQSAQVWEQFKDDRSGEAAVGGARLGLAFKSANAPTDSLKLANESAQRGIVLTTPALTSVATATRVVQYNQQNRFVAGKNFFQNGEQWVDATAQKLANAKKVQLKFGSQEYFDFLAKNTAARPWLALGRQVQFVLDGTVYEVTE